MDKEALKGRLEVFFRNIGSDVFEKECDCGSEARDFEHDVGLLLQLLNARSGKCRVFEYEDGKLHRNITACSNGIESEKARKYWQEFVDEVVSLVGE